MLKIRRVSYAKPLPFMGRSVSHAFPTRVRVCQPRTLSLPFLFDTTLHAHHPISATVSSQRPCVTLLSYESYAYHTSYG